MPTVYLGLGANLGKRRETIDAALARLADHPAICVCAVSALIETAPVGGPAGQPNYLNGAAAIETNLDPAALLAELKRIEHDLGRRDGPRWGPRPIDLDILLYGDLALASPDLTIPHPRLRERRFVLEPLAEIAPDAIDPVTGLAVRALLARLDADG
jgi:2-amino-4-hydroxy-6-hydroxymethyldihydropteridine diphosphokinase